MENVRPLRLGVTFVDVSPSAVRALTYLVTHMNSLQRSVEFEVYDLPAELAPELFRLLGRAKKARSSASGVSRAEVRNLLPVFKSSAEAYFDSESDGMTDRSLPDRYVIATEARFDDNYYSTRRTGVSVIGLGNWERHLAPPTLVEFFLTLLLREVGATASKTLAGSVHYGTRGCVFDHTPELDHVRYKVLNGFVCSNCADLLNAGRSDRQLTEDLTLLVSRTWIGRRHDAGSPAHIVASLGHDLTITKSLQPTILESVRSVIGTELLKTGLTVLGTLIGAVLIWYFGLKG